MSCSQFLQSGRLFPPPFLPSSVVAEGCSPPFCQALPGYPSVLANLISQPSLKRAVPFAWPQAKAMEKLGGGGGEGRGLCDGQG